MAQGDVLQNKRLNAMWQVAATLNMGNANNTLLSIMKAQPDGVYPLANVSDFEIWLRLHTGQDGSLAKWFPKEVYAGVVGKVVDFGYNRTAVSALHLPPQNAAGGSGQCTCSSDSVGAPARSVLCFSWNFVDFTEQPAGSEAGGTWTFSGLSAGYYVLVFADYATAESFPTSYLTVT